MKFHIRARWCSSFSYSGGAALEVVIYYAVCETVQGLMVTQITEAPHSARRAKQLFTVVLRYRFFYSSNEGVQLGMSACRVGRERGIMFVCGLSAIV